MVVGQLTDVFNRELLVGELDLEILRGGGDDETGQSVRRLAQDMTDQRLSDVTTDGKTEVVVRGYMKGRVLASGSTGRSGRVHAFVKTYGWMYTQ